MADRADPLKRRAKARARGQATAAAASPPPAGTGAVPPAAAPAPTPLWFWPALIVLALLEWSWFAWILSAPLPNALRVGGESLRRSVLLWKALPWVIPGNPPSGSLLYHAGLKLTHLENLPQRAPIVLAATLIAGAALALGHLILRLLRLRQSLTPREHLPLAYGLGTIALGLLILALGRLGWLSPWPVRIGLVALIAGGLISGLRERGWGLGVGGWGRKKPSGGGPTLSLEQAEERHPPSPSDRDHPQAPARSSPASSPTPNPQSLIPFSLNATAIVAPFLLVMALGAMLPTYDYDALEYHLQGPKEYFLAGKIPFLPHNVYTSMPFGVEMLHLLGMVVLDDWWWGALVGQLLVASFAPAAAAMIALTASRWGSPRAAWIAAVVYLTTPWVYRLAVFPYVEGPLCYFHAALIWTAGRAWTPDDRAQASDRARLWAVVGLLAGGAMACKYPGLVSAVIPFGLLAILAPWRMRSLRPALAFALGVAVVIGPWLLKNLIDTGNPVYPLAYKIFGGRHWDAEQDAKWWAIHGPRPVSLPALVSGLLDVAGLSDWQSPLYTALAPLALLRRRSLRAALALWGYALYLFLTWWLLTHRLDRFWLPLLPALAILAGLGGDWVRHRAWSWLLALMLALATLANLTYVTTSLAGFNEWTADLNMLRTRVPHDLDPNLARLDATLLPGTKILLVGQAAVFHVRHPIVYNTVFNKEILETLSRDRPPAQVHRDLLALGIDYVYVDWKEIDRFRSPGNYGFTAYITPELFEDMVRTGVLDPPEPIGPQQALYRVRRAQGLAQQVKRGRASAAYGPPNMRRGVAATRAS